MFNLFQKLNSLNIISKRYSNNNIVPKNIITVKFKTIN